MSSQSATGSSASNSTNPFLTQSEGTHQYTSSVPLNSSDNRGVNDALDNLTGGATSRSTTSTTTDSPAKQGEQAANQAISSVKGGLASLTDGQTKPNLAGDLAPSKETMSPDSAPQGTEHVSNILSGIGGAILSAPAAALESISPVAASKVSDGVSAITARLPAVSLNDATAAANSAINSVSSALPAGTADTLKGYVGAAQQKAGEVLPPALGGSTTQGNTGSGELAKPPSQLANEYAGAAQASLSNAATQAQQLASQAIGATKQTASDAAAVTQQKAGEAASIAQQKGSEFAASAQQTASDASTIAQQKASQAATATQQTAQDASNRASAAANQASVSAQSTGQSAADTLNRYSSQNVSEAHAGNHPTTSTGADLYSQSSTNPFADRSN